MALALRLRPQTQVTIASARPPEEVRARLLAAVDPGNGRWVLRARRRGFTLSGGAKGERLELLRLVLYPDPWRPIMAVGLEARPGGTLLTATLRWTRRGQVATAIWLSLCLLVVATLTAATLSGLILPRGMVLAGFAALYLPLPWLDLWMEARVSRELLAKLVG